MNKFFILIVFMLIGCSEHRASYKMNFTGFYDDKYILNFNYSIDNSIKLISFKQEYSLSNIMQHSLQNNFYNNAADYIFNYQDNKLKSILIKDNTSEKYINDVGSFSQNFIYSMDLESDIHYFTISYNKNMNKIRINFNFKMVGVRTKSKQKLKCNIKKNVIYFYVGSEIKQIIIDKQLYNLLDIVIN